MKIDNRQVQLRPLVIDDAYTSVAWRNNPKIWEHTFNSPKNEITIENELSWIKKIISEKNSHRFAILVEDVYVGNIQLTNISANESYYGIFIGNTDYWRKGIGFIATKLILNFGFDTLHLNKVKLRVRYKHQAAFDLYKSIGFNEVFKDDEFIHMEILNKK